jgi:hypothetical protein
VAYRRLERPKLQNGIGCVIGRLAEKKAEITAAQLYKVLRVKTSLALGSAAELGRC